MFPLPLPLPAFSPLIFSFCIQNGKRKEIGDWAGRLSFESLLGLLDSFLGEGLCSGLNNSTFSRSCIGELEIRRFLLLNLISEFGLEFIFT